MNDYYKIIEIKNGVPRFMMKGLNGSRIIELNKMLVAEEKMVKDGTSKMVYRSGFHLIRKNPADVVRYVSRFKNLDDRWLVNVYAWDTWDKPTKGSLAVLAKRMIIPPVYKLMPLQLILDLGVDAFDPYNLQTL